MLFLVVGIVMEDDRVVVGIVLNNVVIIVVLVVNEIGIHYFKIIFKILADLVI